MEGELRSITRYDRAMAKQALWIDGILGSQLRDTQGETLSVEGADISELESGKGRWNDNHGKGFFNCLGRITDAKKIFKEEDCDNDRQRYYWQKIKTPFIYGKGYLYNDEDHPNAKAAAAIIRNVHKVDSPLKVKLSVEGGVVSRGLRDPTLLARTKIHSCAITFVPANQATLVEPLNLDKSADFEADMVLIKSVMHLSQTNVPSFRHITRDASAEKIENNINELMKALGSSEEGLKLKQQLIQDSLESKIADNVEMIHQLVHEELEKGGKLKSFIAGAGLAGALAYAPTEMKNNAVHTIQDNAAKWSKQLFNQGGGNAGNMPTPAGNHQKVYQRIVKEEPILGAIAHVESAGGTNYNHEKDKNGWSAGGMFGMRPTAAQFALRTNPDLAKKYPDLAEAANDINKNHKMFTDKFNEDPEVAADFAKAMFNRNKTKTKNDNMLIHSWNHGLKGTWDKYKGEDGENAINNDEYVQKVLKAMAKQKGQREVVAKALIAGYGGAGAPGSLMGGSVLQGESLAPRLKHITCDNCGKEQVYGKFQVKCREPGCGKAFSMAKLEKFFSGK